MSDNPLEGFNEIMSVLFMMLIMERDEKKNE